MINNGLQQTEEQTKQKKKRNVRVVKTLAIFNKKKKD